MAVKTAALDPAHPPLAGHRSCLLLRGGGMAPNGCVSCPFSSFLLSAEKTNSTTMYKLFITVFRCVIPNFEPLFYVLGVTN
jgi:hypothetical protein